MGSGSYNLIQEWSEDQDSQDLSHAPHWVMAVARLGKPLSYSRQSAASITLDVTEGAKLRGDGGLLIITDDCVSVNVQGMKEQHMSTMSLSLIQTHTNYLVELLPGDWICGWIMHSRDKQQEVIKKIRSGKAANAWDDGLKFVGRIESVRKHGSRDREGGAKHSRYSVQAYGFKEMDSQIFYDHFLSTNSVESNNLGRWLANVGLNIEDLFAVEADELKDNVHLLIPTFMELLIGRGINQAANSTPEAALRQFTGPGFVGTDSKEAPFAYLVPKEIGDVLGKASRDASKAGGILAYADIVELLFGVQKYTDGASNSSSVFVPEIAYGSPLSVGNHKFTGIDMMGAFLPQMPDFDNRPLWSVLQQYLNPAINEMYTCLRVNDEGNVVPTVVLRQIPFTSTILAEKLDAAGANAGNDPKYTAYMQLPRWILPPVLVTDYDVGRSDASRCNFVHVFGQSANEAINVSITDQLVNNAPIRDDFDIQRSGLHTFMTTVAARAINEIGTAPRVWMELIADHRIGSQWTLNGSITCFGIQAPICQGDNVEFDHVVYHIESVGHNASMDMNGGRRTWTTSLTVSNGLRDSDSNSDTDENFPQYPGFKNDDQTALDPGLSVDDDEDN